MYINNVVSILNKGDIFMKDELKHTDEETSKEYIIKELKRVDRSLTIFNDMMILVEIFDFYNIIDQIESRIKENDLLSRRKTSKSKVHLFVYEELMNNFLKYCAIQRDSLFVHNNEGWKRICDNPIKQLKLFINSIFRDYIDFNYQDKFNNKMIEFIEVNSQNSVIQFNNCYIDKGDIKSGVYNQSLPTFQINYDITNNFKIDENQPIEELLLHLSDYDKETKERLLDDLSMCLCNDSNFIRQNGKFIRFYGPTANNGKSTLLNTLQQTLGDKNVTSFSTSQLKKYDFEYITKSLVAFDPDEDGSRWTAEVSRNIKTIVTADQVLVRQIYSNPTQITPITTLIAATNNMPKSEDKSAGISKRLDWFYIKDQLIKEQEWFDRLNSNESSQYFINRLFYNYKDLYNRGHLVNRSDKMVEIEKMFNESNNSAYSFVRMIKKEDILHHTVKDVYGQYEEYCEENDLNILGNSKLNHEISNYFNLKTYPMQYENIELGVHHTQAVINFNDKPKAQVKAWVEN